MKTWAIVALAIFTVILTTRQSAAFAFPEIKAIQAEIERQVPPAQKVTIQDIFLDLGKLPDERLYLLRAGDPCGLPEILKCRGVPSEAVKTAVETSIDLRKSLSAKQEAQRSFYISAGGLAISMVSLLMSAFAFRQKPRRRPA